MGGAEGADGCATGAFAEALLLSAVTFAPLVGLDGLFGLLSVPLLGGLFGGTDFSDPLALTALVDMLMKVLCIG